ncbi:hypothetical protein BSKO_04136 [Bryopsis sp. KO-2023]|nr:hypothetical protein BSKO_04136 [Bryopsis sp. KO-2023]
MFGRSALLLLALLVFAHQTNGADSGGRRRLMLKKREICRALSSFSLVVTQGNCSGFAQLNCQAVIDGLEKTQKSFEEWWKDDLCHEGELKRVAEMSSKLVVSSWVEAAAGITCDGQGYGCGYSISNSDWIGAAGAALARAAEQAGGKEIGFCADDLRLLGQDDAVMIEEARAEACTSGGGKTAFESKFSRMLQRSIHVSFQQATANLCDWGNDVKSTCPEGAKPKLKPSKVKSAKVAPKETPAAIVVDEVAQEEPETQAEIIADEVAQEQPETRAETTVDEAVQEQPETPAEIAVDGAAQADAEIVVDFVAPEEPDSKIEPPQPPAETAGEDIPAELPQETTVQDGAEPSHPASNLAEEVKKVAGNMVDSVAEVADEVLTGPAPAEITDAFENPLLDEIIIGAEPVQVAPAEIENGEAAALPEDGYEPPEAPLPSCSCAEELCTKGAKCNAFPFATCKTVPNNDDCSDCSAKFFIDSKEVTCGIDLCKPKKSLCANKSLAQCCGVCCRCGSVFTKVTARREGLELGFCQDGPTCTCVPGARG